MPLRHATSFVLISCPCSRAHLAHAGTAGRKHGSHLAQYVAPCQLPATTPGVRELCRHAAKGDGRAAGKHHRGIWTQGVEQGMQAASGVHGARGGEAPSPSHHALPGLAFPCRLLLLSLTVSWHEQRQRCRRWASCRRRRRRRRQQQGTTINERRRWVGHESEGS